MDVPQVQESSASLLEKWQFVRRTPSIFTAWLLFALAFTLIGWGALLANLRETKDALEQRVRAEVTSLAHTHADRLMRTLTAFDHVARHVRSDWQRSGDRLALEHLAEEGVFPDSSQYFVTLLNRDGMPLTSTLRNFNQVSLGDLPYFQQQQQAVSDEMLISGPRLSRLSGDTVVNLSRRLVDANGRFNGVVLVSLPAKSFTANYDPTILGTHGLLGVVSNDHTLGIARIGDRVLSSGEAFAVSALLQSIQTGSGSDYLREQAQLVDGRNRFLGWYPVSGYALTALVGLDEADTLAPYRAGRHAAIRYALWATAAVGILTAIAIALNAELAWKNYRLSLSRATYRLATEEGSEGFYILQTIRNGRGAVVDFSILDCNQQGAEFLERRRHELIGKPVSSLSRYFDTDIFLDRLHEAVEHGLYDQEIEIPAGSAMPLQWVHLKIIRSGNHLAVRLRDISQAKAHVAELSRRGERDVLTDLPNRHWIQGYLPKAIEAASQAGKCLGLLFIDLDGFKKVNDTAGHAAGDELLQLVATRLIDAVRPQDKVVRFGGDEFLVLLEAIEGREDAAHIADRVMQAFSQPFRLSASVHAIGTSIGIAFFPDDGQEAATLLEKADIAMYSVKTGGKGSYQFYAAPFYDALRQRLERELQLRQAIERDEFVMYYQPRLDIATRTVVSLEALVRWAHPLEGLLEPCAFIALAEETGQITAIGRQVIDKVCAQLSIWSANGATLVPVSINVSSTQLNEADMAVGVRQALQQHGVPANLLELEITESTMMANSSAIDIMLHNLQADGIRILVDDFGTGYSSLSQLQRLHFDVLKVDKSFTSTIDQSEENRILFTAIVTMAHALGMRVVAEGVETLAQVEILTSLHCDELQGFYIAKPQPAENEQAVFTKCSFPPKGWVT